MRHRSPAQREGGVRGCGASLQHQGAGSPEVGVQQERGRQGPQGVGVEWGRRLRALCRGFVPLTLGRARKRESAKSLPGAGSTRGPGRSRNRRAGGGRAEAGWAGWGAGAGGGGVPAAAAAAGPYLVQEQLQLGGAGTGERGRIHVPAAPRGSARRLAPLTLHAPRLAGRLGGIGGGQDPTGFPHLLPPPPQLRLAARSDSRRRRRQPRPWPRPRTARQSGPAPSLTSPPRTATHSPAPQVLGLSGSAARRRGSRYLPGLWLSSASGNLWHLLHLESRRLHWPPYIGARGHRHRILRFTKPSKTWDREPWFSWRPHESQEVGNARCRCREANTRRGPRVGADSLGAAR
ncbi:uncharacterized protein LOC134471542 [Cavia porcellus]|uniref:uncharacterized protein LOC134471542 n=1 Tax=Cavia porcellus TaxID=10141 RepID=UPI002FE21712